ncbi:uncharacterized protein LOC128997746 [Macrosteles quadrilineatus]|uniref:uncharacterized protein LOC128997746 n=1 Tax=Macrosteles quadrilineatus TaxID=74068 RepID=UPI0023E09163|nr:uncharacterized protein LOC128997746 [Macrosteles quadrilineatus]
MAKGVLLVVDLTWTTWPRLQTLVQTADVAYVHVETPIKVIVRAVDDVMRKLRGATNAVIILEDDKFTEELMYYFVELSPLRMYLLSVLSVPLCNVGSVTEELMYYFVELSPLRVYLLSVLSVPLCNVGSVTEELMYYFVELSPLRVYLLSVTEELMYYFVELSPLRVYLLSGLDPRSAHTLKDIRPSPSFYVVLASTSATEVIIRVANETNLPRRRDSWHIFLTDFKFKELKHHKSDSTSTIVSMTVKMCCVFLGLSSGCDCSDDIGGIKHVEQVMFQQTGKLLVDVLSTATLSSVKFDCDTLHAATPAGPNSTTRLFYQALKQATDTHPVVGLHGGLMPSLQPKVSLLVNSSLGYPIASWNISSSLTLESGYVVNPVKRFFKVGISQAVPWSYRLTDSITGRPLHGEDGAELWTGYCLDFLERLSHELNFDYELVPNDHFGVRSRNGRWNGLVGDLAEGRTDLVVAPLTMTSEREEVVDFVAPYFEQTGISIVVRKPERRTSLFKFMTVLRLEVWLSIVGALIVTGVMIWLLDKYSPYSARNNKKLHPYPCREFTLKESFWFAMTSFTPQGGGETPKALSGRTLVAAYWLFVVLMLATFTANLAAFLTVERMQAPVQSLEQLSRQSRINYTVVANSDTHSYFRNMKHAEDTLYRVWKEITLNASSEQSQYRVWDYPIKEQYGHILQAIEKTGPVPDAATGFAKVNEHESGWFALIHDAAEIRYEVYRNCNLSEIGEPFAEQPYAVAVQQGSQLNEEISRKILDLQKERYFESLSAKYWNTSGKGSCFNSDDNEGITLESLGGVFIATLFGLALAMVTLAVEIFLHKRRQNAKGKVAPRAKDMTFYQEYLSSKEFAAQPPNSKRSKLIHPGATRVITVFPRDQLY